MIFLVLEFSFFGTCVVFLTNYIFATFFIEEADLLPNRLGTRNNQEDTLPERKIRHATPSNWETNASEMVRCVLADQVRGASTSSTGTRNKREEIVEEKHLVGMTQRYLSFQSSVSARSFSFRASSRLQLRFCGCSLAPVGVPGQPRPIIPC